MVERFFSIGATSTTRPTQLNTTSAPITLLAGPPSSGKTSLAFQFAINAAASNPDRYVVFLSKRLKAPPYLSQGVDSSSPVFNRLHIKYVDDDQGLKKYFAAFHLLASFPVAVVVDDLAHLFDDRTCQARYGNPRGREMAVVRLLSLCQNAIDHANKSAACELLLTETHHGDSPKLMFIYKRWINSTFLVKGDGSGSFLLQKTIHPKADSLSTSKMAKYSIALQHLLLDGIFQPSKPHTT